MGKNVSEKHATSILEDGSSTVVENIYTSLPYFMMSHSKRL
jgi:hypothetical protein